MMTSYWVEQGTLVADGKSLEYRCFGPSPLEAPTIVLLHEGLGCAELWRDFPQQLSDACGWGVMAYSRAGYGQSDPADLPRPLNYMSLEATHVLPQVLNAIDFQRGVLLGHSDGATIAAIYAGSWLHPDFKNWNVSEVIDYWRIPVLAIQGRQDQYGTLAQIQEIENRSYAPVDTCILEDCRHTPYQDQPAQVLEAIAEFVTRLQRIDSSDVAVGMDAG